MAEEILGGRMVCPLDGDFEVTETDGVPRWKSTAWQRDSVYLEDRVPEDYCHPFLDWLRGARMELTLDRNTLSTHVELDVKPSADFDGQSSAPPAALSAEPLPGSSRLPAAMPDLAGPSPESSDARDIQGTWKVVKCLEHGEPVPNTEGIVLHFEDGKIIQTSYDAANHRYEYRLRPELQPKGFDFLAKGRQIWDECGIYRLEGNRLVICCGHQSKSRPVRLDAEPDDVRRILVLNRVEAGDPVTQ